jgi:hypothetical protein
MPQLMAVAIVLVAFTSAVGLVHLAGTAPLVTSVTPEHRDVDAYFGILDFMRGGSGYYHATHEVLLEQGYGTASVFNWRTPAWPLLLALLPSIEWAQVLLAVLALVALLLAYRMIRTQGNLPLATATTLSILASLALLSISKSILLTEVASGVLILLSVVSYGNRQSIIGLVTAMAALFIRELAAPYILLCIAFAVCRKNKRELVGWALGLLAYLLYFAWHWIEVARQLGPTDRAYPEGWIQFGGIRFILETAHFNGIFFLAPLWLTAALLPAALTGLFAWHQGLRAALTVTVYLCIFAVVGKPFNYYWGALYTPVLMLGLPWSIPAVYDALASRAAKAG